MLGSLAGSPDFALNGAGFAPRVLAGSVQSVSSRDGIEWALKALSDSKKAARRKLYADYDAGRHQLNFASDKFLSTFGYTFQALSENLCPVVIDTLNDLLQVEGFLPSNIPNRREAQKVVADLNEIWRANRMQERHGQIQRDALLFEDTYAIVWPDRDDPRLPVIYPNAAGNVASKSHPQKLGYLTLGAKWWLEGGRVRLNVYYPDRTEKWVTSGPLSWLPVSADAFTRFYEPDGSEPWPLPNPYGKVPLFRFVNNAGTDGEGRGELLFVIPLQNGLNKSLCDMMVSAEFEAFAQRWITGLEDRVDPKTGKPLPPPFRAGPGNVWAVASKDTKMGEFTRGDPSKHLVVQDGFRRGIARVSGTPLHYLALVQSDFPSGESLKTASEKLTNKARDRGVSFGCSWGDLMRFSLEVRGRAGVDVQTRYNDPTPRQSEAESWSTALTQQKAGVDADQTLIERGYTEEQIGTWRAKEAELLKNGKLPTLDDEKKGGNDDE